METNKSSGKISKVLIILAAVLLVVIVVVFVVIRVAATKKSQTSLVNSSTPQKPEPPKPVYETTIGDIRFLLISSEDLGNFLKAKSSYEPDLKTTEKFIKVVIGAQNKGKNNTDQYFWDIGNIVDSEGRNFIPDNQAYYFLPRPDLCGSVLKPEFRPISCVKIYEVSRLSKNLKIEVKVGDSKKQPSFIDLKLTQ